MCMCVRIVCTGKMLTKIEIVKNYVYIFIGKTVDLSIAMGMSCSSVCVYVFVTIVAQVKSWQNKK